MRGVLLVMAAVAAVLQLLVLPAGVAGATSDRPSVAPSAQLIPPLWRNCTNYNKRYPHGVGRLLARDKVRAVASR